MRNLENYIVNHKSNIRTAIKKMDIGGIGFAVVQDEHRNVVGIITDGDFRRAILNGINLNESVLKITNKKFEFLEKACTKEEGFQYIKQFGVEILPVIKNNKLIDLITGEHSNPGEEIIPENKIDLPVVIMAGGKGTRMEPFTKVIPKPLIPIGDTSILEIIMNNFSIYGMKNFYLCVNYKAGLIKAYIEDAKIKYNISYIDEDKALGTAGALHSLKGKIDNNFFVSNCDIIIKHDYSNINKFHEDGNYALTMVTSLQHYKIPYGVCKIENGGSLKEIQEKPEYDVLVNTGMYILSHEVLNNIPENKLFHLTDLINALLAKGLKVGTYPVSEKSYIDIGQWKEYKRAIKTLQI